MPNADDVRLDFRALLAAVEAAPPVEGIDVLAADLARMLDAGRGFDWSAAAPADPSAEQGRAIAMMRAMADRLRFEAKPEAGAIVHLEKLLQCIGRPARGPRP